MNDRIITGLASYGMSGKVFHAPLISCHPGYYLKSIVQRHGKESSEKYPWIHVAGSIEEIISDKEISLVVINTPDNTHVSFAKQALMAGKHVVVEKPFTINVSEGEELLHLAREQNKVLTVFHNRRWDGDFLTVKNVIEKNLLGRLVEYEAHFDRYKDKVPEHSWKEDRPFGGGLLYNLGSHLIDQALVLFDMPKAVTSDIRTFRPEGRIDDFFELILHYSDKRVMLKSSYLTREQGPRFQLHGTKGSFLKYGTDPQEESLKNGQLPNSTEWGKEQKDTWGILHTEINGTVIREKLETIPGNYLDFYSELYDSVKRGKQNPVSPEDAIRVIRIIESAVLSNKEHRTIFL